ncbi:hypothetical protein F4802DRAFT_599947 [Xylaria palmicola]|nr:hypothetical protein F4802DRAFT_599947 [Xylaria palmicola]
MLKNPDDGDTSPTCRFDHISEDEAAEVFKDVIENAEASSDDSGKPVIAKVTEKKRDRALGAWKRYRTKFHKEPEPTEFWIDLCKGDFTAKVHCQAFLRLYVKASRRRRLTLGPEESVIEQGIKSCRTVNTFWKSLIAAADAEYLLRKRQKDKEAHWMTLVRPKNQPGWLDKGVVSEISLWIYNKGAELTSLSDEPEHETVELTARDIAKLPKTLWVCADDIPVQNPAQRVIFHALVLFFSYGGFRQGMIMGEGSLRYRDISMAIVRDPEDGKTRRLVATPIIRRNKLKRNALEHKKGTYPRHSSASHAKSPHAASRLVLSRQNLDPWKSCSDDLTSRMLTASLLTGETTCLTRRSSPWLGRPSSESFAGADLDGCLTAALRNFILSHSTDVYENNYTTRRFRQDLAKLRFGVSAGLNELPFDMLRDLTIYTDSGAPIDLTKDQLQYIESRQDIKKLTAALDAAKLHELLLIDSRTKYFAEANELRANGKSTAHIRRPTPAGSREHDELDMEAAVRSWTEDLTPDMLIEGRWEKTMDWLVHYMDISWRKLSKARSSLASNRKHDAVPKIPLESPTCFLCLKTFKALSSLTRHCTTAHLRKAFNSGMLK